MQYHILIPARYHSSRFPGKMLAVYNQKPLIQHVYERAVACGALSVHVATDDQRIQQAVSNFGGSVYMTKQSHTCGTERLAELLDYLPLHDEEIVVNLQGDEPHIPPEAVAAVVKSLVSSKQAEAATLAHPITEVAAVHDPNVVKVVLDRDNCALYFSRSPIPYDRDDIVTEKLVAGHYLRHIGLYAFRVRTLRAYSQWEEVPNSERLEKLEQLRMLWHGTRILVNITEHSPPRGVDTAEDLAALHSQH